jgi:hydroxymethylpyrimidine pyrophosphatase-like HAD family hydrolase
MKRLFIVDLDDTLLFEGALPPNVIEVWRRIVLSGAPVTIATARGLRAAMAPLGDAVPRLPIVALNGAVVATSDGKRADIQRIPVELVDPICRLAEQAGAIPCLLKTDGRNDSVFVPAGTDAFTDWTLGDAGYFKAHTIVRGPASDRRTNVVRIVLCTSSDIAERLHHRIENEFSALAGLTIPSRSKPGRAWFEIGATSATKAHGISHVASLLQVSLQDVVYYGDTISDLGAMAIVGEAVAVADAKDDVLAAAHRIIGPAGSGAVALDLLQRLNPGGNTAAPGPDRSAAQVR